MKKYLMLTATFLFFLAFSPSGLKANNGNDPVLTDDVAMEEVAVELAEEMAEADLAEALMNRLYEIEEMDKSEMSRAEKRELRKEVRSIQAELRQLSGGVYISAGALIIILLLLIILT
jgi:hypothetical protein